MALTIGAAYEQTKQTYQLKLMAGEDGLYRSFRWLYFTEDISNTTFLRGGELMVITGFSLTEENTLVRLIEKLIALNFCGLMISAGKYIREETIAAEVLDLCNRERFPLILMPWRYHLADITQDYSHMLYTNAHANDQTAEVFRYLLNDGKTLSAEGAALLQEEKFGITGRYCVAVLSCWEKDAPISDGDAPDSFLYYMGALLNNQLSQIPAKSSAFFYLGHSTVVFYNLSAAALEDHLEELMQKCGEAFPHYRFACGLGSAANGVQELRESWRRASAALSYGKYQGERMTSFEALGIFKLLYACPSSDILASYTEVLRPLEEYDRENNSQLLQTLQLYLELNRSINLVSNQMFCHRNTTNYRMKKIWSLLNATGEESDLIFSLRLAFAVRSYQKIFLNQF